MSTRFIIVGYYNLSEGFLGAANALLKLVPNSICDFFPLTLYSREYPNNLEIIADHLSKFINGTGAIYDGTKLHELNNEPDKIKRSVVIWWHNTKFMFDYLGLIKSNIDKKTEWIYYSWDDPNALQHFKPKNRNYFKHFDLCISCNKSSINFYLLEGAAKAVFSPPGVDLNVHHPLLKEDMSDKVKYYCDINLVCTNLYEDSKPGHLNRKQMLDALIKDGRFKIHLYGPEHFKQLYPSIYKGYAKFADLHKIFHYSSISLCTHVTKLGYGYINERVCQILGSGGLLYIDNVGGLSELLDTSSDCIIIDENNYCDQLNTILDTYKNNPDHITSIRAAGYDIALNSLQWKNWADVIITHLNGETNDTSNLYSELFNLLCSTYVSNFPITGKLKLIESLTLKGVDINKFINSNMENIHRHSNH